MKKSGGGMSIRRTEPTTASLGANHSRSGEAPGPGIGSGPGQAVPEWRTPLAVSHLAESRLVCRTICQVDAVRFIAHLFTSSCHRRTTSHATAVRIQEQ